MILWGQIAGWVELEVPSNPTERSSEFLKAREYCRASPNFRHTVTHTRKIKKDIQLILLDDKIPSKIYGSCLLIYFAAIRPFKCWRGRLHHAKGRKSSALPKQISKVSQGNDFQSAMWDRRVYSIVFTCIYIITSKMADYWHQTIALAKKSENLNTLQGTNISHLGKRKIIFKMPFLGDMLIPWRVVLYKCQILQALCLQETRPDHITPAELRRLRRYGCTRVQIGVQHTDDDILKFINRGHDRAAASQMKDMRSFRYGKRMLGV